MWPGSSLTFLLTVCSWRVAHLLFLSVAMLTGDKWPELVLWSLLDELSCTEHRCSEQGVQGPVRLLHEDAFSKQRLLTRPVP